MDKAEKIMNLAVRRGFFWPAYEIYGGVAGTYAWGPLGVILKERVKSLWRSIFVDAHDFLEIDTPSIAPFIVFKASGHVENFRDIMVSCGDCGRKYRADTILEERGIEVSEALPPMEIDKIIRDNDVRCPVCGGEFREATYFITMFKTTIGPYKEAEGFLRPETAQGIFVEFKRLYEIFRRRFPVGVAQIGRGFRNEISPRQGPIRLREFDMMEIEYFYDPNDPGCPYIDEDIYEEELNLLHRGIIGRKDVEYETLTVREALKKGIIGNECMAYFMVLANRFLELLGIPVENIRFKEKLEGERAHYAIQTFDQEVKLSRWGWIEVSGHANRTDYDLSAHIKMSGKDLYAYRSLDKPKKVEVIEVRALPEKIKEDYGDKIGLIMSRLAEMGEELLRDEIIKNGFVEVEGIRLDKKYFSIDRVLRNVSVESFVPHVIEPSFGLDRICYAVLEYAYKEVGDRVVLSLPPYVAPYDAAVFPLLNNKEFVEKAVEVRELLVSNGYRVFFDVGESIGRRYARADEIGVPAAFTIDHQTFKDNTVTVRDRDSWRQYRISIDMINKFVEMLLGGEVFDTIANNLGLEPFTS